MKPYSKMTGAELAAEELRGKESFDAQMIDGRFAASWQGEVDRERARRASK